MSLITKLDFIDVDLTGCILTFQETTGEYDATNNPHGYGGPNITEMQVEFKLLTISKIHDKRVFYVSFVNTLSGDDEVNEFTIPSIEDISIGTPLEITSQHIGVTQPSEGVKQFEDGVYDVNLYNVVPIQQGSAVKGRRFITSNFQDIYDYDAIIVNGKAYNIDIDKFKNNQQFFYIDRELEDDAEEFYPAYRGNTKAYSSILTQRLLDRSYANLISCIDVCDRDSKMIDPMSDSMDLLTASQRLFYLESFAKSHDLLNDAYILLQRECR